MQLNYFVNIDSLLNHRISWVGKPLKLSNPTVTSALPMPPLNHVTKSLIYRVCEHFQGQ